MPECKECKESYDLEDVIDHNYYDEDENLCLECLDSLEAEEMELDDTPDCECDCCGSPAVSRIGDRNYCESCLEYANPYRNDM
ncbi:hypothetical protein ADMFC3_22810 [Geovibrio sp. ADMFC3]